MSTTRKFLRNMDKVSLSSLGKATKLQKVVSAVTAMGFVLQPVAAMAQIVTDIQPVNGDATVDKVNGHVTNVWAGTVVEDVALNVFKKFDVGANDIANMYFREKGGNKDVENLVNLVFSKININGTVNAIQNSKIGGNLFFLSKDGMAVSGSGVIKAGSLTVMTPTPEHLVQAGLASWADKEAGELSSTNINDALKKAYLVTNWAAIKEMKIPINKLGNITVQGRINTTNGINLKAAHINVSKDTDTTTNPKDINPILQSGILDFSSMVNTTDAQGNSVDANIQNLTAATAIDGSGDIVLSAVAESVNTKDADFAVLGTGVTGYNSVQADVTVGEGAQLIAHQQGDVKITAEAAVGKGQGSLFDIKSKLDDISADDLIGTMAKTVAKVNIDGKVEGNKIDIQANAENKYVNGSISNMNNFADGLLKSFIPRDSDVNYVVMENKADVNIGEKAVLVAHAQNKLVTEKKDDELVVKDTALNITANANMKASAGSAAAATKLSWKKGLKNSGSNLGQVMPNAGVTYLETDNQAHVSIKGSVKSAGGSNIAAKAQIEAEAAAAADSPSPVSKLDSNNFVNAAVTVADIKNSAQVDIAGAVNAKDGLRIEAKSKGSYTTAAEVNAGETSMANTAINITDVNSSARVNINGSLEAKNIDIAAQNDVENDFKANNSTGLSKLAAKMATKKLTAIGDLLGQTKKKSLKAPKGLEKLGEMFTVGASVGVINETNKADVTIGKDAVIKATGTGENEGKLNVAANTNLAGSYVNVSGTSSNYKKNTDQQVMVNASVLVSNMDSSANVVVEAGEKDDGKHAVLQGKAINVNANSEFTYARPQKMVADLKSLLEDIKSAYEADKEVLAAVKKLLQINQTEGESYFKNPSEKGAMEFFGNLQELADLLNGSAIDANMEGIKAITSLPGAILAFVDGSRYANFYVASSTAGRDGSTGGNTAELAVAGAVNVNQLANNAQVIIGRNAVIKADGGDVSLNAKAVQQDVTLNGKMKYVVPGVSSAGGGVVAVGGNVGVHHSDVNSVVAVAGGAELSGENINIGAENEVLHIAATYGGGKGGSIGVSGMAAYIEGASDSIAAVDDKAKLNAKDKLAITAKNDTNIQNIIAEFAKAGGSAVGGSVGYVDYQVNNIAAVANIDKTATRAADDEVSELNTLLKGKLQRAALQLGVDDENKGDEVKYADLTEQLGEDATGEAGSNTAKDMSVAAETSGVIDNITVAGSVTGGKSSMTGSRQLNLPVNITGAGSASVNIISGNTAALLEDTAVTITATADKKAKSQGAVKVLASDDSMIGAYSGAAALKKQSFTAKGPGVALAGAVAYNKVESGVIAQLKNVKITAAKSISNEARKEGAQVAAGLAAEMNTSVTSSSTSVNGAASASANEITNKVHAVMNNVTTSASGGDKTDIANIAQDKDIQIAGGITAQYARGGGVGVGVAASYQDVTNDIQSKIIGSDLKNVGSLQAYAASQLVQVGTAVSVGVMQGQSANGVEGAAAINKLTNNVGVTIDGATIKANSVEAKAFDGKIESTIAGDENTQNTTNKHLYGLATAGFDVTGADAMDDVNAQQSDVTIDEGKYGQKNTTDGAAAKNKTEFEAENKGNLIVTGATSVIANISGQGKLTAGAAASTNNIKNNFTTKISGGTLTANSVKAEAKSDTLMVGVAAGVAASTGQTGAGLAGSASVMQMANNTTATIEKATINAAKTGVNAATSSRLINITGQVSATKGNVAAGLTTATNVLNNTTGAYIYGASLNGKDNAATEVDVKAENKSDAYAIAVGVAASTNQSGGAANGAVAVNKGVNNTEAVIDKAQDDTGTTINNAGKISVNAVDETKLKAISGGVTFSSGYAGVGGAVSYNQIGEDGKKQNITAQINNADITTATDNVNITIDSQDKSDMLAIAAGLAATTGQTGAAAQGSAATTILHKNNEASMTGTKIDSSANAIGKAELAVTANSTARTITSADAIGITAGNAAGGAAVAVTNSKSDNKASITGGEMNLKSGKVQADSKADIINVGIGVAAATGQGGSLAGNVAVNNIGNNTTASITKATMNASGTIGVLANSKEHIRNYAGALAATVGQGYAAGGLSTAVNAISGDTNATVSGSSITAAGHDDGIKVTEYAKDSENTSELTGLVVNADSAHEIDNVVVTAGAAVTAEAAVAASGTVTVNNIHGSTVAGIESTNVNSGNNAIADTADVSVRTNDNTKIDSHVGSAAVATSANAGVAVGEASDSNVMNREVTAQIVGDSSAKNTVNADKLTVNAFNKHDILSNAIGIAGAGGAYGGVGVSGTTSVLKATAETTAQIININSKNNGLTINADHINKVKMLGNSAAVSGAIGGASVGTAIAVLNDDSKTEAKLSGSVIKHYSDNSAADAITAKNDTDVLSEAANIAVSAAIGAGVSGVITVNNMDNAVYTTIENSTIGEDSNKAQSIKATANNKLKTEFASGSASGGFVAAGVGVGVNTIDTSVITNVSKSSLYANDVTLLADENRDIDQTYASAGVGGVGFNATVLVTNIGTAVSDKYGVDTTDAVNEKGEDANGQKLMDDGDKVDISKAYKDAGTAIENQNNVVGSDKNNTVNTLGGSGEKNILGASSSVKDADGKVISLTTSSDLTNDDLKNGAAAGRGGKVAAQGVKVNVSASTIKANAKADIKADATTDAKITVGKDSAAGVAVGATVGILNVKRNSGVNITNSGVTAKTIDVKSEQDGTSAVKVYQGGLAGTALNVVYSGVHLKGQNDINIKGSTLAGTDAVTVATGDTSTASLETIGVSGALTSSANIFVVDGKNDSSSKITVASEGDNSSELTSDGNVTVEAKHGEDNKDNQTMTANIIPVAVAGMASGLGFNAMVEDNSKTTISVGDNQKFTGKTIDIKAENNSVNKVSSVTVNAALGAAIGATGVQVKGKAGSELKVGKDNTFTADAVNLGAKANVINDAEITAVGAGFGSFMVNWATANGGTNVEVDVGDNTYAAKTIRIKGESFIDQHAKATGLIAGMYTSGTNLAKVDSKENVVVKAGGNNAAENEVNITAEGLIKQKAESNGYGGAYVDVSPAAAITKSNITSNTKAIVTGNWNAKTMKVNALHDNQVELDTDALKAAVVGLSGVWAFSDVKNDTNVTLDGAAITTEGDAAVEARNDITYSNKVQGGGYGAVTGNAMDAKDEFAFKSNVALNNSSITAKGKVDISAITGAGLNNDNKPNAAINKNVTLKSAGLVAGSLAFSEDKYTVDNMINVNEGSAISTIGNSTKQSANDITLKAYDVVGFTDVATADTQGGAVGAASTKLDAKFNRSNTITVKGKLDSNYDAELNAGGDSLMNVTLKSNAYNKTAAPIVAIPGLDYRMEQNNRVIIGARADAAERIKTTRNIDLIGDAGNTTIATQSSSYMWTQGGTTSNSSLASTADGTQSKNDVLNNGVEVNGKLLAGKNDKLEITITDGKDNFDAQLKQYVEENLKNEKSAYDAAKAEYDKYVKDNQLNAKQNSYNDTKEAYDSATIIAKTLNDSKSAEGGVDKLKSATDNNKTALDTAAKAWWDANKTTDSSSKETVTVTVNGKTTVLDSLEAFLQQDNDTIAAQIIANSKAATDADKQAEAYAFIYKIQAYNTAQSAYTKANESLSTSASAAGVTFDSTTGKYVVSQNVSDAYAKAKNAYYDIVGNATEKIEANAEYKKLKDKLTTTENAYNAALAKQDDIVSSVNDYIKKATDKNFVNVKASDWFEKQNDGSIMNSLSFKNYAQGLTDRLAELEALIHTYSGSAAEEAFKGEKTRLQNELIALGLGYYEKSGDKNTTFVYDDSASTVPTVDLKNILVTGGNINIKGGKLAGTGEMKAVGNPTVEITNNSKYYLRVNDITIDGDGGNVKFNDVAVKSGNGLTVKDSPGKLVGSSANSNALIKITSTAAKAKADEIYTPDVGIFGTVYNPFGKVEINNSYNNIYVASQLKDENGNIKQNGGSIKAREIALTAGGSITQGYNDGIVNVGGNPHYAVTSDKDDPIKEIQKALVGVLSDKTALAKYRVAFKTKEKLAAFLKQYVDKSLNDEAALNIAKKLTDSGTKEQAGMYASGAIYINAANININGTVQSGYDTYKVDVDQNKLNALLNKNHEGITDFKTDAWLVTSGTAGAVYDDKAGKYVYNVSAWYNPVTGEIFTEDIDQSGGGRIHIMGAVASTGGGKLVALDGGADVSIKNKTDKSLAVGAINADKVKGEITIIDTNKNANGYETTVYTRDKVEQGTAKYNPKTGQMYIWTSGESSQVITTYKAEYDSKWFGLDKDSWESQLDQVDKVQTGYEVKDQEQTIRGDIINDKALQGTDISNKFDSTATSDTSGNVYQISFERSAKKKQGTNNEGKPLYWTTDNNGNKVLTTDAKTNDKPNEPYYLKDEKGNDIYEATKSDAVTTKKKKLWGLWGSHVTTTWKETKGMLTSYNFGLKADNQIDIAFIGNKDGGSVGIESAGNIKLNGDIRANDVTIKSAGSITADSFGDALNQKTIFTDNLKLEAGQNIEIVQQGVKEALNLSATAGAGKENYIKINTLAGINTGDVYINKLSSEGDITLDVQGQLLNGTRPQAVTKYAVRNATNANNDNNIITAGGKLILKAADGIGDENNMHIISAVDYASLLAESGNIWAKQAGNDAMKLKQVEAKNGDVHLEAAGGFVDALEDNQKNNASQEERIKEWKAQGILSDKSLADQKKEKYDEQVNNLKAAANNILGNGYTDEAAREAAADALIAAGETLTKNLAEDYRDYYAARKDMYTKQAALNEAISKKNNGTGTNEAYDSALYAYNTAFAKYALAKKTYEDKKASAIEAYVTQKDYTDGSEKGALQQKTNISQWLANYEELTHEAKAAGENKFDKYGWNQNQLLYALQDSIINLSAGSVSDVNKANIIGNNIYLTTNGDIGQVMDNQAFTIKMDELSDMFANGIITAGDLKERLDKLAGARADDVTWGTSQIEVKRLTPISVKLNNTGNAEDGKVTIYATKAKNIYIIAKDSKLTMDKVISEGNVRLTGQEGIDIGTITGSNISLEGGKGNIQHGEDSVLVGLIGNAGKLNANAAGNILLQQLTNTTLNGTTLPTDTTLNENMVLGSLAAKNIKVEATGNIVSGLDKILDASGKTSEASGISYINASEKLTLMTDGSVGTDGSGLRVKNSGGIVDITAQNGAYLEAKGDGTLVLGTIKTGSDENDEFVVNSEGGLSVGREANAEKNITAVEGSINGSDTDAKANVKLTTAKDLTFSGKVRANELTTQSYAGNIKQTTTEADNNIEAEKLNASAIAGDIELANPKNVIKDINIQGLGGNLELVVSMENLNLKLGSDSNALSNNYGGDFKITNNAGNINVKAANTNIYGNIVLDAAQNITVKRDANDTTGKLELNTNKLDNNEALLQKQGNITLTAGENITNAGTINANVADITDAEGNVTSGEATITLNAKKVTNDNALNAKTNVDIDTTAGDIANNGTIQAGQNVDLNASGMVDNKAAITAENDAILTAGTSIESNEAGTITSANDTKLKAGMTIKLGGAITARGSISGTTATGSINVDAAMKSANGGIKLDTNNTNKGEQADITINGTLQSDNGNIEATTKQGDVEINGTAKIDIGSMITTVDNGSINFNAEANVNNGDIITDARNGNIRHNANMTVGKGDIKDTASGTITSPRYDEDATKPEVKLTAINGSVKLEATDNGDINIYEIVANNGKADIQSRSGNVYLYKVNGKEVILVTKSDIDAKQIIADKLTTKGHDITLNIAQEKGMVIDELLAANEIKVTKAKGSLDIEKLAVENKAYLDVNGMTTTVWGKAPERNDSYSIYWFNVNAWKNDGDWMTLTFNEKQNIQGSNAALLRLRNYSYVYNQRFTAVDHLHQLLAENKAAEYDINFKPDVVQYFRHDLYDLDESGQQLEEHAGPAKIVIEA